MSRRSFRVRPRQSSTARSTYLLAGGLKNKSGHATLTNDRVLFFDEFYRAGKRTISALQRVVATKVQDRLDKCGPVVDMPLTAGYFYLSVDAPT